MLAKSIAGTALICLSLASCAQVAKTYTTVTTGVETLYAKVKDYYADAPKTVYALESGYVIVQTAMVTFKQTQCPSVTSLGGKCATIVPKLRTINKTALAAIRPVSDYVRANPTLDNKSLIQTAEDAVALAAKEMTELGVTPVEK